MNGIKAKRLRREKAKRFDENGLPRDAKDWLAEDWECLYRHMIAAQQEIAERHRAEREEMT